VGILQIYLVAIVSYQYLTEKNLAPTKNALKKIYIYRKAKKQILSSFWTSSNFLRDIGCIRIFSFGYLHLFVSIKLQEIKSYHSFLCKCEKMFDTECPFLFGE